VAISYMQWSEQMTRSLPNIRHTDAVINTS